YRCKHLCANCYKEVYENGPASPTQKSVDDDTVGRVEKASVNSDAYSRMMLASAILSDSTFLTNFKDRYLIIYDQALTGLKFDNLNKAINVMAEKGWRCSSITSFNIAG